MRCLVSLLLFFALTTMRCQAQAGPPYLTDDPDPVPRNHFEAYIFELSDGTKAGTALMGPSYEMNYGAAPNLQLHLVVPFVTSFTPGSPATHGLGDIELGAKYKLLDEKKYIPEIGVFPFIELPTGNADKGLGVGKTWYRVPIWVSKHLNDNWSLYGGGGEMFIRQDGYQDSAFSALLVQRKFGKKLVLGTEIYGHGAQNPVPDGVHHAILVDFGGYYSFTEHMQFMFAGGHSVVWQAETYTYAAMYWTWGKDPQDKGPDGSKDTMLFSH